MFVTARLGSTRLPRKALLPVGGKPALQHLIERVHLTRRPDLRVLCTTTLPEDDELARLGQQLGLEIYRGDPDCVTRRYLGAARQFGVELLVTAEGDDLFADPEHMDRTIDRYHQTGADLLLCRQLPLGASCYAVKVSTLLEVEKGFDPAYTGSFVPPIVEAGRFTIEDIRLNDPALARPDLRMTLDYPEDLSFFEAVCMGLGVGRTPTLKEIICFLDAHPEVRDLNRRVDEKYWANYRRESGPTR